MKLYMDFDHETINRFCSRNYIWSRFM